MNLVFKKNRIIFYVLLYATILLMVVGAYFSFDIEFGYRILIYIAMAVVLFAVVLIPVIIDTKMHQKALKKFYAECDAEKYLATIKAELPKPNKKFEVEALRRQNLNVALFYKGELSAVLEEALNVYNYVNIQGKKLSNSLIYANAVILIMNVYKMLNNTELFYKYYSEYAGVAAVYPKNKVVQKVLEYHAMFAESLNGYNEDLIERIYKKISDIETENLGKLEYYYLLKQIYFKCGNTDKINEIQEIIKTIPGNTIYNYNERYVLYNG